MKFIKENPENERRDYILQKDKPTKKAATIIVILLIIGIIGVLISGYYFEFI